LRKPKYLGPTPICECHRQVDGANDGNESGDHAEREARVPWVPLLVPGLGDDVVAVDGDEGEDPGRRLHAHVRHEADVGAEEERLTWRGHN